MQILFDTKIQLNADPEKIWELLTSPAERAKWQDGVEQVKLISGDEGYRGAQSELSLTEGKHKVIEQVQRSCPQERLQLQFKLGDCSYQQIIHLSKVDVERTQLTYHCKQKLDSGWRRVLNISPSVPACVKPAMLDSLAQHVSNAGQPSETII